jgi:uncharacterized membrane protein YkvA (DUF1232 family)
MKISFELSKHDLDYFRARLQRVRGEDESHDEAPILQGAAAMVEEAYASEPPEFVVSSLKKLEALIALLKDGEWRLEGRDRVRILDALAYFVDPDDMIPDRLPGIGYLDDAIMVELIAGELKHEIKAYDDFCEFRGKTPEAKDEVKLEKRRMALQGRMRRRQRKDLEKLRTSKSTPSRLRLF